MSLGLVRYDAMCEAIAVCRSVDEVKELRNKAKALEVYAQQARNLDAERKCCEVRIRAERRAGELLKEMKGAGQRHSGKGNNPSKLESHPTTSTPKLADLNITKDQSSKWQQLAEVPAEQFERAISGPNPTTEGIIVQTKPAPAVAAPPIDSGALWLWGRLRELEERGILGRNLAGMLALMTDAMRDDCLRVVPTLFMWIAEWKGTH